MEKLFKFRRKKSLKKKVGLAVLVGVGLGLLVYELFEQGDFASTFDKFQLTPAKITGDIVGQAVITDGDTIKINGIRIRFHGIDAPELNQPCWMDGRQYQCGIEAKAYLNHIVNNQTVVCQTESTDQYGRKVAKCFNYQNEDIEALMVSAGMAVAYYYYSYDYALEELEARYNERGIWAGDFENPYDFRSDN